MSEDRERELQLQIIDLRIEMIQYLQRYKKLQEENLNLLRQYNQLATEYLAFIRKSNTDLESAINLIEYYK